MPLQFEAQRCEIPRWNVITYSRRQEAKGFAESPWLGRRRQIADYDRVEHIADALKDCARKRRALALAG